MIDWTRIERSERVDSEAATARMIIRVAGKDKSALKSLYQKLGGKILAIVRSVGVNDVASEDVLVNVFERIWRHAHEFDGASASPNLWLLALIRACLSERLSLIPVGDPANSQEPNAFALNEKAAATRWLAANLVSLDGIADPGVLGKALLQEKASA